MTTLSSLFIVCSHGRRSAHGVRPTGNPGDWCPGGRPATLEDLGQLGEKGRLVDSQWKNEKRRWTLVMDGDIDAAAYQRFVLIPLPQMVAGESL